MSFFGFDTTLPRDRGGPNNGQGFFQTPDPFAGIPRPDEGHDDGDDDGWVSTNSFIALY
jgi:DNA topoisomerase 2-associated protein PAT1